MTSAGKNLIGNLTGSGNQTSATGNATAGNQTMTTTTTTNTTTTTTTGNQTSATGNMTGSSSAAGNQTGTPKPSDRLTGRISSIQTEDGKPAWIQGGIWMLKIGQAAAATTSGNATSSPAGNATSTATTGNVTASPSGNATTTTTTTNTTSSTAIPMLDFIARFDMVKLDGSAMHQHNVTDLKASTFTFENGTYTINGTATVTMKDGPVQDVPVAIKIMKNSVISMTIGPDKVDKHFGTDPIYGTVAQERS